MNIFFFGNTSFTAQNLSKELELKNKIYFFSRQKKTKNFFYYNLEKNEKNIFKNLKIRKIDYLFFFSSFVPSKEKSSKWEKCKKINIYGLTNLIKNINLPIKKIILASSCSVYGDEKKKLFNEKSILKPRNFYSISKFMQEKILQVYCKSNKIDFLCYRIGYVFGKRMDNKRLVKRILVNYRNKKKIKLFNKGLNLNLIHTENIAYLILKTYKKAKGIFNLANPKEITLEMFYKTLIKKKFNKKIKKNNFSTKKLYKKFYYLKKIDFKESMLKFINEN